jgi:succinyl-CoA synthetase beta subunit
VLADEGVKAMLVNIFAGINRCDWIAEGSHVTGRFLNRLYDLACSGAVYD